MKRMKCYDYLNHATTCEQLYKYIRHLNRCHKTAATISFGRTVSQFNKAYALEGQVEYAQRTRR